MKKVCSCVLLCLMVGVFGESACWGLETLMIEEDYRTHVIKGQFSETVPGGAFPTELFFSYEVQTAGSNSHDMFYFLRQTGEDSFEIRHTWATFAGFRAGRPLQEVLKVSYKAGGEYPLPMTLLAFPNCQKKDAAILRMLSLTDNVLGYRIILPECLREALKKEEEKRPRLIKYRSSCLGSW